MVKTRIFEPVGDDSGETPIASRHRKVMRELMGSYGMDLPAASQSILEQIAAGRFWVSTQPEMTQQIIAGRVAFLSEQSMPTLNETARQLIEV
jgi:hypothetical protein